MPSFQLASAVAVRGCPACQSCQSPRGQDPVSISTSSINGCLEWFASEAPREADIAELVAPGLSNREIAARLVISERTVHGHIRNILTKLDATSRAKIASWYVQRAGSDEALPSDENT